MTEQTIAIIGAGPLGLELACSLAQNNTPYLLFDKGQLGQMIYNFPPQSRFFSSSERISIAGMPLQTVTQEKCSREYYLAYLRSVALHYRVKIHSYEEVLSINKQGDGFQITTSKGQYAARAVVLATGGTSHPRKLNIPGEELPFVHHTLLDPHFYFQKHVAIIGGKNSAAEAAIRLYHAGAKATLIHRGDAFEEKSIKYWILPELLGRIQRGEIQAILKGEATAINQGELHVLQGNKTLQIPVDFVLKAIGFEADMHLFKQLKIPLKGENNAPEFNPETMETPTKGAYVLGTVVGGTQSKYRFYIENTHEHVDKILKSLDLKEAQFSKQFSTDPKRLEE